MLVHLPITRLITINNCELPFRRCRLLGMWADMTHLLWSRRGRGCRFLRCPPYFSGNFWLNIWLWLFKRANPPNNSWPGRGGHIDLSRHFFFLLFWWGDVAFLLIHGDLLIERQPRLAIQLG